MMTMITKYDTNKMTHRDTSLYSDTEWLNYFHLSTSTNTHNQCHPRFGRAGTGESGSVNGGGKQSLPRGTPDWEYG